MVQQHSFGLKTARQAELCVKKNAATKNGMDIDRCVRKDYCLLADKHESI
jgi:hypothetical protein